MGTKTCSDVSGKRLLLLGFCCSGTLHCVVGLADPEVSKEQFLNLQGFRTPSPDVSMKLSCLSKRRILSIVLHRLTSQKNINLNTKAAETIKIAGNSLTRTENQIRDLQARSSYSVNRVQVQKSMPSRTIIFQVTMYVFTSRSQWPRGLRRRSEAARLP